MQERKLWVGEMWPSVLPEPFITSFRTISSITTADELSAEGRAMKHCVGSYHLQCNTGQSQIWSLRGAHNKRESTLETGMSWNQRGQLVVNIIQHKGFQDTRPSAECQQAATLLLSYLRKNPDVLKPYLDWKRNVASRDGSYRTQIAESYPIIAALREVLPKAWSLEHFVDLCTSVENCRLNALR